MGRRVYRLSSKTVETRRAPGYYPDGLGLYLQVAVAGTKSWIFRYTLRGRAREMGLGSLRDVGLGLARNYASEARTLLRDRRDPIEVRNARRIAEAAEKASTLSTRDCWTRYIAAHKAGWRNAKHADQWTNTLETYAGPVIGSLPVSAVDTAVVLRILEPIWSTKTETAGRLRARIESVLDWARVRGYRMGENPARWRGHLDKLLPKRSRVARVEHHAALPYVEIGEFMATLREQQGEAARALEFAILTCGRTGEVIGARPVEFDLDRALWLLPASRMKGAREHRVPLAPAALALVRKRVERGGEHVFAGGNPGEPLSNMAMLELLKRIGRGDLTVHGFRSTFRDWAAERTNYPRELAELALAHKLDDKTEAAYLRSDMVTKRAQMMAAWARFCGEQKPKGEVTPLRKRA